MSNKIWAIGDEYVQIAQKISASDNMPEQVSVKNKTPLTVIDNTAIIDIKGVLGYEASWLDELFGFSATSYESIIKFIDLANLDPNVEQIALNIESGGGIVIDSIWEASDAIYTSKKPVTAYATNYCCSAAYLLASQASDGIVARHDLTNIGSIGVMATYYKDDKNVIVMRSSNANLKNADPEQYPEQYQASIDAVEKYFINHISRSLGLTTDKIVADFGKGATITALEALERGMIKEIYNPNMLNFGKSKDQPEAQVEQTEQVASVDVEQIKAESYQAGIVAERERVATLTEFAAKYNAPEAAANAIKDGLSIEACMEAMLQEQQRNLTAKANQQEVEPVAVADTQEQDLETANAEMEKALETIGA